ncbi:hypothetical protein [Rhodococcus sp. O3]|uniref:hypothetical protein n=1 Tax=Rhodococcus sp. O3 TaxID=3404919 RepID=UPI003B66F323
MRQVAQAPPWLDGHVPGTCPHPVNALSDEFVTMTPSKEPGAYEYRYFYESDDSGRATTAAATGAAVPRVEPVPRLHGVQARMRPLNGSSVVDPGRRG